MYNESSWSNHKNTLWSIHVWLNIFVWIHTRQLGWWIIYAWILPLQTDTQQKRDIPFIQVHYLQHSKTIKRQNSVYFPIVTIVKTLDVLSGRHLGQISLHLRHLHKFVWLTKWKALLLTSAACIKICQN